MGDRDIDYFKEFIDNAARGVVGSASGAAVNEAAGVTEDIIKRVTGASVPIDLNVRSESGNTIIERQSGITREEMRQPGQSNSMLGSVLGLGNNTTRQATTPYVVDSPGDWRHMFVAKVLDAQFSQNPALLSQAMSEARAASGGQPINFSGVSYSRMTPGGVPIAFDYHPGETYTVEQAVARLAGFVNKLGYQPIYSQYNSPPAAGQSQAAPTFTLPEPEGGQAIAYGGVPMPKIAANQVEAVQELLGVPVDGKFGPITYAALKAKADAAGVQYDTLDFTQRGPTDAAKLMAYMNPEKQALSQNSGQQAPAAGQPGGSAVDAPSAAALANIGYWVGETLKAASADPENLTPTEKARINAGIRKAQEGFSQIAGSDGVLTVPAGGMIVPVPEKGNTHYVNIRPGQYEHGQFIKELCAGLEQSRAYLQAAQAAYQADHQQSSPNVSNGYDVVFEDGNPPPPSVPKKYVNDLERQQQEAMKYR